MTLSWTSPRDRIAERVVKYDIRYSENQETLEKWSRARKVKQDLMPHKAGNLESITVERLSPNSRYYFGVKAIDHSGDTSPVSNTAVAYTADTIPPKAIIDLMVVQNTEDSVTLG